MQRLGGPSGCGGPPVAGGAHACFFGLVRDSDGRGSFAAPVTPPHSARSVASPDHALHSEAVNYARNLVELVDRIEGAYVRPVSRVDLYEAALAGLYEAVREPCRTACGRKFDKPPNAVSPTWY